MVFPSFPCFPLLFFCVSTAVSHRNKDVKVETIVGLPEEEDEGEAEDAGAS